MSGHGHGGTDGGGTRAEHWSLAPGVYRNTTGRTVPITNDQSRDCDERDLDVNWHPFVMGAFFGLRTLQSGFVTR